MKRKININYILGACVIVLLVTLHAEYLSAAPFPVCQARTGKGGEGNTYENTYGRREI